MLKAIIIILLIAILVSLFSGLFFLVKDEDAKSKRTANALAIRVALAALLIGIIFVAAQTGHLKFNPSPINAF